ncbi:S9 family peptidase [Engelhardtia mirabilis]|uniref:Prolyl tripeptidyl peptidase n=1 Tax=Engelhardtia mirabilis TaxID=2528011 RepID=A0A518BGC6_9BACT|nr:Prolyl tripeptidyl peptidase precursor [Planctomycetes bacterium Pla133]QDV00333.1 Prolyl tripeptidyl peptidase precursor [Planctomycetes bacterium Pla86]
MHLFAHLTVIAALAAPSHLQEAPDAQAQTIQRLTIEDVLQGVGWTTRAEGVRWAWDGLHLAVGEGDQAVWLDPATLEEVPALAEPEEVEDEAARPPRLRVRENELVLERPGAGEDGETQRTVLTTDGGNKSLATLSPDGSRASYVRDGDLLVVPATGGESWAVAAASGEEVLEGVLDWVYQEEIYGRGDFRGHWWSPDSASLAFLRLDQREVPVFPIVDHIPNDFLQGQRGAELELTRYPKSGDSNPVVGVGLARPGDRTVRYIDLSAYPEDLLVLRVDWAPDGRLLLTLSDRIQTWAELVAVDPQAVDSQTVQPTTLLREESETWVNRPEPPLWLKDGSFLWQSERSGYRHIEHRAADGSVVRAITSGDWQVRRILEVDEEAGVLWFEGTRDGAIGSNVYRVGLDGQGLVRLTPGNGWHSARFDDARRYLVDTVSSVSEPPHSRLVDGVSGEVLREFAPAKVVADRSFVAPQRLTIVARDGYPLDATVIVPASRTEGARLPVFLDTYSGPDAPTVSNRWQPSTWHQFLAQEGVIVLQVNVRTASGRGQAHTGLAYRQLGVVELRDLEDAVDHVVAAYGADPARVAISGWSYGGFMAGFALTHSDKFALGFAGAGVHDWQLYDTIYTERYMSTPIDNPEGYAASSVIGAAGDLQGHLVLMHGTMDDNVHMQNTLGLVDALQRAGKENFELMLYVNSRHGVRSPHLTRYRWRVLRERFGLGQDGL